MWGEDEGASRTGRDECDRLKGIKRNALSCVASKTHQERLRNGCLENYSTIESRTKSFTFDT